ncbi:MAG: YkvA family protein [Coleofasciculaceae cyanobacterium]
MSWQQRVRQLKQETYAIYIACKDPRVPWYVRVFAGFVVAYAFSPIDFIPDFIPILGYLDDLILVPLGIFLVIKMIPSDVLAECREKAEEAIAKGKPTSRVAAIVIVTIWLLLALLAVVWVVGFLKG